MPDPLRTPRAAAVAGIVFTLLLTTTLVLLRLAPAAHSSEPGVWLADPGQRRMAVLALNLVRFTGIAFLWFIGVVRDRFGNLEDRFFATVSLGSGLLFIAMLFVAAAVVAGGVLEGGADAPSGFGRRIGAVVLHVYAMRMAAVFTISTATMGLRTGIMPRWLGVTGYAVAAVLLLAVDVTRWVELLFPLWILVLSIDTLASRRSRR